MAASRIRALERLAKNQSLRLVILQLLVLKLIRHRRLRRPRRGALLRPQKDSRTRETNQPQRATRMAAGRIRALEQLARNQSLRLVVVQTRVPRPTRSRYQWPVANPAAISRPTATEVGDTNAKSRELRDAP